MRIALVDDERAELESLSELLRAKIGAEYELFCFESGEAFLDTWRRGAYDLVILDIFMSGITGMDTARRIRETDREVRLVFATTSNEFASESYEVNACYYMHKPYSAGQVDIMLSRLDLSALEHARTVTLPDGQSVLLREVIYAEYSAHNITIHNKNSQDIVSRIPLSKAEALLCAEPAFISPSKGIIVNLHEVQAERDGTFLMLGGASVPISRRRARDVRESYAAFRFETMRKDGERG